MNKFLQSCVNGRTLKTGEAEKLMEMMMNGDMSQSEIGGILSVLAHRGETAEELAGFVKVMRARAQTSGGLADVVDTCGTGGDGISTFNISTVLRGIFRTLFKVKTVFRSDGKHEEPFG